MTVHNWTDAENELIRNMWLAGARFRQIADALATPSWTPTRNMIAGKIHRFKRNAPERPKPKPPAPKKRRPKRAKFQRPSFPLSLPVKVPVMTVTKRLRDEPAPDEPVARMLTVMQLGRRDCKWPIGDPKMPGFGFCGAGREGPLPYCRFHALIAYQPVEKRKRA